MPKTPLLAMPDIHIQRDHPFSLAKAREVAHTWAERAEADFGMACTHQPGDVQDVFTFARSGVKGTLKVCAQRFELDAQLGFLFGAFKDRIEGEITQNLDRLLAQGAQA